MKKQFLEKIFVITLTMMIVLTIGTIPTIKDRNVLQTSFEIEDITSMKTSDIYLLNKDNLLVKAKIINEEKTLHKQIERIVKYLIIDNEEIPKGLKGYLRKDSKILDINVKNGLLTLNLNSFNEDTISVTGLTYSLLELKGINKVKIMINGNSLKKYDVIDKNMGINNEYLFHNRKEINKVVIYYLDNIYNNYYFVPVTKYLNDDRDKIKISIEELKHNQELISKVPEKLELKNYSEEGNVLFLNFNNKLQDLDKEAINEIAYSSFENYDINMVVFEIDNKKFDYRKRD